MKRKILEIVSSNPTLKDKTLSIEAKKPFLAMINLPECPGLRGGRSGVRTLARGKKSFLANFRRHVKECITENPDELANTVALIQDLEKRFPDYSSLVDASSEGDLSSSRLAA